MTTPATEQALAHAITTLNTAEFEPALYAWLGLVCDIDNVTMIAFFKDRGPEVFFSHADEERVFAKLDSHYLQGAYLLDPVHSLHIDDAPEALYLLRDIAPDQFHRNEYFATYYGRTTLVDELVFLAHPTPGVSVTICIGRDVSSARKFSNRAIAQAQAIAPIVTALANQNWRTLSSAHDPTSAPVAQTLRDRLAEEKGISLSPRQSEIAFLILQGHSSVSIGLTLGISPQTVKVIRKQLYKKCNISSQAELFSLLTPYLLGV